LTFCWQLTVGRHCRPFDTVTIFLKIFEPEAEAMTHGIFSMLMFAV